jgi:hypothetical protein
MRLGRPMSQMLRARVWVKVREVRSREPPTKRIERSSSACP